MAVPFGIGRIIDTVLLPNATSSSLITMLSALGGVFVVAAAANYGRTFLFHWSGTRLVNRLRSQAYRSLLTVQPLAFHDTHLTGDLASRLSNDTSVIAKAITMNVSDGVRSLVTALAGTALMAHASLSLSLTVLCIVPPLALCAVTYGRYVKTLSARTQTALGDAFKLAQERLANIRTVKSFSLEEKESSQFDTALAHLVSLERKEGLAKAAFYTIVSSGANAALLLILWKAGRMVMEGAITVGDLSAFLMYAVYVGSSVAGLSSFFSDLMKGAGAYDRIQEMVKMDDGPLNTASVLSQQEIASDTTAMLPLIKGPPKIDFHQVTFAYPTRPNVNILDKISFTVQPNETLAIVGPSGSGKSTIAALLLKLYKPTSGQICIDDDLSLSQVDTAFWHQHVIAAVSQEPVLFSGTVAENIAYGRPDATMEEIREAARQANALTFIEESLPDKFDTIVGERGVALSGGQKQRVAIARACLLQPRILLLDEATSALDAQSEHLIQEAIDRLGKKKTVVIIAHRLSTIKRAQRILFIYGGRIQAEGSFEQLAKDKKGLFYKTVIMKNEEGVDDGRDDV